ncbi:MAG: dephospho-CoA kinase [Muribaculaceae bacterium]|nr:dephospho-CoA kinase [Muribaculaceae bacterium]
MGKKIGITGGIGAGKSIVSRLLRLKGFTVYDCDSAARSLMEQDPEVRDDLTNLLGQDAFRDNHLNRQFVAERIFGDKDLRERVNKVVHKAVREDFLRMTEREEGIVFIESAIPVTGGLVPLMDEIWVVEADEATRIERVKKRNGLSEDQIVARIKTQQEEFDSLPAEKTRYIDNDGESSLILAVERLLQDRGENRKE